ncbi:hypothetical protein FRC10_006787 [Ceratobasidium sp. 414]|nr:hypothetical protein FRC10_006787 [Ceratobasidium sp. 414]
MSSASRKAKQPRKSAGSDVERPTSPGKARSTKRRKTDHVKDDGVAAAFLKKIHTAENALKEDLAACEAHMAREEAEYAAAMERIVNARREAAIWREGRIAQCDGIRRELMAQQQDAELAAELARMRVRKAQGAREASLKERHDQRQERKKRKNAELRRAEEERAARQQPEIIVESDLCYISDLDDEFMDAEDEPASSISDFDGDSADGASVHSHADDDSEDEVMANTTARPGKIEVDEGGESDDELEIEDLSNHSDYTDDDSSHAPPLPSFRSHLKAAQAAARAQQELRERQARARAEAEQAYAERERVRREREWRAQQEAAMRQQQEQLKREQERIKRERQERARREYEQRERERQQQQRRAEASTSRNSVDASSGATVAAWARYTSQWNKLQGTGVPGKQATDAILYFSNIPWPTVRSPRRPEDISKEAVAALVLSPSHNPEKGTKARLRELLLLWHPDKFVGRWMTYVVPADRDDVTEGVMAVARIANELLAERNL